MSRILVLGTLMLVCSGCAGKSDQPPPLARPDNPWTPVVQCYEFYKAGNYEDAVRACTPNDRNSSREERLINSQFLAIRALAYANLGDCDEAVRIAEPLNFYEKSKAAIEMSKLCPMED